MIIAAAAFTAYGELLSGYSKKKRVTLLHNYSPDQGQFGSMRQVIRFLGN